MTTGISFEIPPAGQQKLSLRVTTSDLDSPYSMDFSLADVPSTGVLSVGVIYPTFDEFAKSTLHETPCGDPYRKGGVDRLFVLFGIPGLAAWVTAFVLLIYGVQLDRRRLSGRAVVNDRLGG